MTTGFSQPLPTGRIENSGLSGVWTSAAAAARCSSVMKPTLRMRDSTVLRRFSTDCMTAGSSSPLTGSKRPGLCTSPASVAPSARVSSWTGLAK